MSYLSLKFLLLFIGVFYVYWNIPDRFKKGLLVFTSLLFYSFFSVNFLFHFAFVTFVNYLFVRYASNSRYYLASAISFNVLNLAFFKYVYFILETVGAITGIAALSTKTELNQLFSSISGVAGFEVVLPATISYYTFQFISLHVDNKNGKILREIKVSDVFSYVFFFPVMIAGPITRYENLLSGLDKPEITKDKMTKGLWKVLQGIIKKVVLSDSLVGIIYPVFGDPSAYSGGSLLLTTIFFAIHLYLDFSGLTDMARGLGILLGVELPENFKAPFFFTSFSDFWRRWHLSFSFWIRDYIYIPLGGSRVSQIRNYLNLLITFTLGGLWHGASFNYVIWGFYTGVLLSLEKFMEEKKIRVFPDRVYIKPIKYVVLTFCYMLSWVLFFTPDLKSGFSAIWRILSLAHGISMSYIETGVYVLIFAMIFHATEEWPARFERFEKWKPKALPFIALFVILYMIKNSGGNLDFFYEKF